MSESLKKLEKERLEDVLFEITAPTPQSRINGGSATPFVAISHPFFDLKNVFDEEAWDGLSRVIEDSKERNPEYFNVNPFQLFILGGAISDWRFMMTKNEGTRLSLVDYSGVPLNQEGMRDLEMRLERAREQVAKLPENVSVNYVYSTKDHKNIIEMFSLEVDNFATMTMGIYNSLNKTNTIANKTTTGINNAYQKYEGRLSRAESEYQRNYQRREERHENVLSKYNSQLIEHENKIHELDEENEIFNSELTILRAKRKTAKDNLRSARTRANPNEETIKKWVDEIDKIESDIGEIKVKASKNRSAFYDIDAKVVALRQSISDENDDKGADFATIEDLKVTKLDDARASLKNSLERTISNLIDSYSNRRDNIASISNDMIDRYNTETMGYFKEQFDTLLEFYDLKINGLEGFLEQAGTNPENFAIEEFSAYIDSSNSEFSVLYDKLKEDFSISEMFSRVTKRKIPPKFRHEIFELVQNKYMEALKEFLSDDGKRNVQVRRFGNNNFSILGADGETMRIRASGFGNRTKFDLTGTARRSLRRMINSRIGKEMEISGGDFIESLYDFEGDDEISNGSFEPNDYKFIAKTAGDNENIDLVLAGPFGNFAISPIGIGDSSHTTNICTIGPFARLSEVGMLGNIGAKTDEYKMSFSQTGAMLGIFGKGIMSAYLMNLEQIANFDGFDEDGVVLYHDGDEHVGAGNHNTEAHLGYKYIQTSDNHVQAIINSGDNIDGEVTPRPKGKKSYPHKFDHLNDQFSHFLAIEKPVLEHVLDNSNLETALYYSQGQHDASFDAVHLMKGVVDYLRVEQMSEDERLLMASHLRLSAMGHETALDNKKIDMLSHSNQGFGVASLTYEGEREVPFANILVAHAMNSKKSSKYNQVEIVEQWDNRTHLASQDIRAVAVGDKHQATFALSSDRYFTMNGTFKGTNRDVAEQYKQSDAFERDFGYTRGSANNKLFVPENHFSPIGVTIVPQFAMENAYEVGIKPRVREQINNMDKNKLEALVLR